MLLPPYQLHERVRLIRLYSGMNQSEMARMLGMTQGWLSKLESGSSELTAEQLFLIRRHFQLSADAVMDGLIPYGELSRKFGASIKLPRKYATDPNCRARVLYGFVKLYEEELGKKAVTDFFRSMRVKPEILANPDFPINLNLVFEFIRFGMDRKVLGNDASWAKVAEHTLTPMALGLGFTRLSSAASPADAFRRFCDLISQFATDFEPRFSVAGKNSIEIALSYPQQINRIRAVGTAGNVVALSLYTRAILRTVGQISSDAKVEVSLLPFPEGGKIAAKAAKAAKGREMLIYRAQWR